LFGEKVASHAVEVLTLVEMAWHDCYGEARPPAGVVDDMLVVADGRLDALVGLRPLRSRTGGTFAWKPTSSGKPPNAALWPEG
jgi:hypothetical protein